MKRPICIPIFLFILINIFGAQFLQSQTSARVWMNAMLRANALDESRPTVHSRNMFHASIAMYDLWAIQNKKAEPYFLGKKIGDFECPCNKEWLKPEMGSDSAIGVAINYAVHRLIDTRWLEYSSKNRISEFLDSTFIAIGGNLKIRSTDYSGGSSEALGNYLADCLVNYGLQDGSHEIDGYESFNYETVNQEIQPDKPGSQGLKYPDRWQPVSVRNYLAKRGLDDKLHDWNFVNAANQDAFLGPEWGEVVPFALGSDELSIMDKDGNPFNLYLNPGPPPLSSKEGQGGFEGYRWGFALVGIWSGFLDPSDKTKIDISPGAIGNNPPLPENYSDFPKYFDLMKGGTPSKGHKVNPATGKAYLPNLVSRGDYGRVIAEYWVDGINTASPPGHWIRTLNYVGDHPDFEKRWLGKGKILSDLEWDVKAYFMLSGAMHDAAIAAWSVKGYYDYVRPISAIRWMGGNGQSTDPAKASYHPKGLPLIPGHIELVRKKDALAGEGKQHVNKIKLKAWKGPDFVENMNTDMAGVGWILAENWWPYQRYAFTTPPFAGYVSGHSTFSVAAAEVLATLTGDPYFPGGIAEFTAKKNEFLQFEEGPAQDLTLQWATYRDAADETCLSRIWGGIHPPADDINGRKMGEIIAVRAFEVSSKYFLGKK